MQLNKITLAIAGITIASTASAAVTITPLAGYHYAEHDKTAEAQRKVFQFENKKDGLSQVNSKQKGIAVGLEVTPNAEVQVEYTQENSGSRTANGKTDPSYNMKEENVSANLLLGPANDSRLKPYVLVGAGRSKMAVKNTQKNNENVAVIKDVIANVGAGAKFKVNDNLALRGEARAIRNFDNKWWEGVALGGLEVKLGGKKAPVEVPAEPALPKVVAPVQPPKPVDSDRDGVPDNRDACRNTPANAVVDARGCQLKVEKKPVKMELRVFFDKNKANIKPQFKPEIAKVARGMKENPNSVARIEGHASKTGSARYNLRLSEARAVAVKRALSNEFGINPRRIATRGFGYNNPIAPNNTPEGRAMNRRVYAIITSTTQQK